MFFDDPIIDPTYFLKNTDQNIDESSTISKQKPCTQPKREIIAIRKYYTNNWRGKQIKRISN